jgi:hypothetical protein
MYICDQWAHVLYNSVSNMAMNRGVDISWRTDLLKIYLVVLGKQALVAGFARW